MSQSVAIYEDLMDYNAEIIKIADPHRTGSYKFYYSNTYVISSVFLYNRGSNI